jgi:cytochrome c oxidase subunit II
VRSHQQPVSRNQKKYFKPVEPVESDQLENRNSNSTNSTNSSNLPLCLWLLVAGCWFLIVSANAPAATITGKVSIAGTVPENPKINMDADPVCKSLHAEDVRAEKVVVNANQTLRHVFVYVKEGFSGTSETPKAPAVLDQKGCMYQPHVLGLQTGQPLSILNSDATLHNVHAFGQKNPEFNLGMPIQGMKLEKTFFNPEVMLKFKCDVHPWMNAYLGVLPHPFSAVTGEEGNFEISGLPAGEYTVEAWHETYGTKSQKTKVGEGDTATLDFEFSSAQIADEATGVSIKVGEAKPVALFDDSKALNVPRKKTGWWLPDNVSTYGEKIDFMFHVILGVTGVIFFGVQGTLIYFLIRYRGRDNAKGHYTHGNALVEIIWTAIPTIILIVLALMGQKVWAEVKSTLPADPDTVPIRIQAEQFAWNIQYPGPDGKFDTADDIKNINQLHIPVGRPVRVTLTSIEKEDKPAVIHSFFLPEFRLKQDVVPGMAIEVWFEAKKTGQYEIACAEFCGLGHYRMRGFLSIHSPEGFEAWLREQAVQ